MSQRSLPFEASNGRQSPFRRQNSHSPATIRPTVTSPSTTKANSGLSPTKQTALSPEKLSPFVRKSSQISRTSENQPGSTTSPPNPLGAVKARTHSALGTSGLEAFQGLSTASLASKTPTALSPTGQGDHVEKTVETEEYDSSEATLMSPTPCLDGASYSSELRFSKNHPSPIPTQAATFSSTTPSNTTISKSRRPEPPIFLSSPNTSNVVRSKPIGTAAGAYNHISQPLLHSMRESFEVLDSHNTGTVSSSAVSEMLSQLGMESSPNALRQFFPSNGPAQLNLARYLDMLSGPLVELSDADELRAAFEAFDVDDSGQIDTSMLRDALMYSTSQSKESTSLGRSEVDSILAEFSGRRAFGGKGLHVSKEKGEVFKYRDFMASISTGSAAGGVQEAHLVA